MNDPQSQVLFSMPIKATKQKDQEVLDKISYLIKAFELPAKKRKKIMKRVERVSLNPNLNTDSVAL